MNEDKRQGFVVVVGDSSSSSSSSNSSSSSSSIGSSSCCCCGITFRSEPSFRTHAQVEVAQRISNPTASHRGLFSNIRYDDDDDGEQKVSKPNGYTGKSDRWKEQPSFQQLTRSTDRQLSSWLAFIGETATVIRGVYTKYDVRCLGVDDSGSRGGGCGGGGGPEWRI
ncbi:hypothetical protein T08_8321 [Trichinella sp. T8]|nr:hypothetical protein T08_8321 [Trichinella sp. T8]